MDYLARSTPGRDRMVLALVASLGLASACTRENPAFKPNASRTDTGNEGESGETLDTGVDSLETSGVDSSASGEVGSGTDTTDTGGNPCPDGEALCDGECIDVLWDPFNCGDCGNECFTQESCVAGDCQVGKVVFVTSVGYPGNMGGLVGADMLCSSHALAGELDGEYKAWLADDNESPASRLTHFAGGYRLPSGIVVAESWDDLTDGSLLHPIDETEFGDAPVGELICAGEEIWSGVRPDGTLVDQNHCNGWTQAEQAISHTGRFSASDGEWTQSACMSVICTAELSFYCVQQ